MRTVNKIIVSVIVILLNINSYPQGVLITKKENFVENPILVDKPIKEKTSYINIDVEIPQIVGLANKDREKDINNKILDKTNLWIKDVKDTSENLKPTIPYEVFVRYSLTNDKEVLSFYIDYYQFSGGAHGITIRDTYNIKISSGENLQLKDLFNEGYDYTSYINEEIRKEVNKYPENYFPGKEGFNGIKENQQFYINDGKLIIHFPYYEIAPYASGMPEFTIEIKKGKNEGASAQ